VSRATQSGTQVQNGTAVAGLARAISRRRFLHNLARWGLGAGVALSTPFTLFQGRAQASTCSVSGAVSTWGCSCNPDTALCSSGCSSGTCGGSLRKRCNYWTTAEADGNYCWCSLTCCRGNCLKGYYVCCDCWSGGSGGCDSGTGPCVCRSLVITCQGHSICGCGEFCESKANQKELDLSTSSIGS
jgi:hypothetical protein